MAGLLGLGGSLFSGIGAYNSAKQAANTPMGVGALFGRMSGQFALQEAQEQSSLQLEQSRLAYQEGVRAAIQRKREYESARESQAAALAHGGLTLSGSGLAITEETYQLGQQEYNALMQRADAQSKFLERDALRILRGGYYQKFQADIGAQQSIWDYQTRRAQLSSQASQVGTSALFSTLGAGASLFQGLGSKFTAGFAGGGGGSAYNFGRQIGGSMFGGF